MHLHQAEFGYEIVPVNLLEREPSFSYNQSICGLCGGLGGFVGDSERFSHVESLLKCGNKQPNCCYPEDNRSVEKPFCEKGEFTRIIDKIIVALGFLPLGLRYALSFGSFVCAFFICLFGWFKFYDERKGFGSLLLIISFVLGCCRGFRFSTLICWARRFRSFEMAGELMTAHTAIVVNHPLNARCRIRSLDARFKYPLSLFHQPKDRQTGKEK